MKEYFPEQTQYSMDKVTIESLVERHSDADKFGLPFELQGHGEADKETGNIFIQYPRGDIFLSVITAIHEAGHPRQEELNTHLQRFPSGPNVAAESDAWQRGWGRFTMANQEFFEKLESKFQGYREQGKLKDFASFQDLYEWVRAGVAKMLKAQRSIYDSTGKLPSQYGDDELRLFNSHSNKEDFVRCYESTKVNELIDNNEFDQELKKTAKLIINE